MTILSDKFSYFIHGGVGWEFLQDLVRFPTCEPECAWLLRWLTVDALVEITYEECIEFSEYMGRIEREGECDGFVEDLWGDSSSESSYHPSECEVEFLDDVVDPTTVLLRLLPGFQAPVNPVVAYAQARPYGP